MFDFFDGGVFYKDLILNDLFLLLLPLFHYSREVGFLLSIDNLLSLNLGFELLFLLKLLNP